MDRIHYGHFDSSGRKRWAVTTPDGQLIFREDAYGRRRIRTFLSREGAERFLRSQEPGIVANPLPPTFCQFCGYEDPGDTGTCRPCYDMVSDYRARYDRRPRARFDTKTGELV